jgi:hypothetical protein
MPSSDARGDVRITQLVLSGAAAGLAVAQAVVARAYVNPDAIPYLDIARSYVAGDWQHTPNAFWSPLYSWLLAIALGVTGVSRGDEADVAHALNAVIFLAAIVVLWVFTNAVVQVHRASSAGGEREASFAAWPLYTVAFGIFLWATFGLLTASSSSLLRGPGLVTPDLIVVVVVMLASSLVLRLRREPSLRIWLLLGVVLGIGYFAKTAVLVAAPAFIAGGAVAAGSKRRRGALLAVAAAAVIAAPFALAISVEQGSATIGDSGRLAWAWALDPPNPPLSKGETPALRHPARLLLRAPHVYQFLPQHSEQTFPLYDDPAYWYQGTHVRWTLARQLVILRASGRAYARMFTRFGPAFIALLGLFVCVGLGRRRDARATVAVMIGPLALVALYAPVETAEPRFVAGACAVVAIAVAGLGCAPRKPTHAVAAAIAIVAAFSSATPFFHSIRTEEKRVTWTGPVQGRVAQGLAGLGVCPGRNVGLIGNPFESYWALAAGLHVVASGKIAAAADFWQLPARVRARAARALSLGGSRPVVADPPPNGVATPGWEHIGKTGYLLLRADAGRADRRGPQCAP